MSGIGLIRTSSGHILWLDGKKPVKIAEMRVVGVNRWLDCLDPALITLQNKR